ncbi:hypothetical protein KI688_012299 [Linnemannia hyalina]|uniref:HCP-like protein n=1 Tax=Linnemannia hyalina TaxID=64524 RepID=A0A9P7XXH1_9FUNG|nr:hypothetical protein KI688_012299 [Linnemannia hyalina]
MVHSEDEYQDIDIQVVRLVGNNSRTVHITTHQDPSSGKHIILWGDILQVFRGALYLQHGKRVLPFMKDSDFRDLDPPRIAAIPGEILDIVIEDSSLVDGGTESPRFSTTQEPCHPEVARLYEKGVKRHIDVIKSFERYLKAAEAGDAPAQTILGEMYMDGAWGVPEKDMSKSFEWYLKAAESGDPLAQRQVGVFYSFGLGGVPEDASKAFEWYMKAAVQGNSTAQFLVAEMYSVGYKGVPPDDQKAEEWSRRAEKKELEVLHKIHQQLPPEQQ